MNDLNSVNGGVSADPKNLGGRLVNGGKPGFGCEVTLGVVIPLFY